MISPMAVERHHDAWRESGKRFEAIFMPRTRNSHGKEVGTAYCDVDAELLADDGHAPGIHHGYSFSGRFRRKMPPPRTMPRAARPSILCRHATDIADFGLPIAESCVWSLVSAWRDSFRCHGAYRASMPALVPTSCYRSVCSPARRDF